MAQLTCRRGPPCNCPELAWLPASAETDTGRAAESASEWPAPRAETPWTHLWKQADRGSGLTVSASPASSGGALRAASEGPGGAAGPALAGGGRDRPVFLQCPVTTRTPLPPISGVSTWGGRVQRKLSSECSWEVEECFTFIFALSSLLKSSESL